VQEIIVKDAENLISEFVNLQYNLYAKNSNFIGDLKSNQKKLLNINNPFWQDGKTAERKLFLAYKNDKPVGRLAAIINHTYNKYHDEKIGFFGFYDVENDIEISKKLFENAYKYFKDNNIRKIRGPFNPSTNYVSGMLADSFDKDPKIMMPYNFEYYLKHMEAVGFTKAKDLLAFDREEGAHMSNRLTKIIKRIESKKDLEVRAVSFKNFEEESELLRDIYNKSWAKNWGFVPISKKEFTESCKELQHIINPKLTSVISVADVPAGFAISIPDLNCVLKKVKGGINLFNIVPAVLAFLKIKKVRLIMLGVLPEYRKRGLELLLIKRIIEEGNSTRYKSGELSWILEDNVEMINIIKEAGAHQSKTYRIFEKLDF
jgi:hypothetical protein